MRPGGYRGSERLGGLSKACSAREAVRSRHKPRQERAADSEPERIRIVIEDDRTGWGLPGMVTEEGNRPVLRSWRDPDLRRIIDEGLRMVVLDWGWAHTLVTRLAGAIRSSQRESSITALVPYCSDSEVGARRAAGFFISKQSRATQIRRALALACGPQTDAIGHVLKMPAGSA